MTTDTAVSRPSEGLLRAITQEERDRFAADGVVRLRSVIPESWVEYLRSAVQRLMDRSDPSSQAYTAEGRPRFFSQAFSRFVDPALDEWARFGPGVEIARQMHPAVRRLRFFFDQVFAMEPGVEAGAPFHQDYPYLPIDGEQYFRIWVPLDSVSADSGALRYLRGSHRGPVYRPLAFSGNPDVTAVYERSPYPPPPDFDAIDEVDKWVVGEAEPGDALLHHPKTVHGSPANQTSRFRRAVTTIYVGDDVRWDPRPGTSFDHMGRIGEFEVPEMVLGDPVEGDLFPLVWGG